MHGVIAILVGLLVAEAILFAQVIEDGWGLGADAAFYMERGRAWLETGAWYYPFQLEPHAVTNMLDNLYPPTAVPLFVAGAVAPWPLWWVVPIAITAAALWRCRPSPWAWVVILVLLMWPRSIGGYLYGNTTMWTTAGLAAGLAWGWPVVLIAIKTTVWPWGVLALRHRSAWLATVVVVALSVTFQWQLWFDYVEVLLNTTGGTSVWAFIGDMPPMLIPVVAWVGGIGHLWQRAADPEVKVGVGRVAA